jgi:hypothetical protein
MRSMPMALGLLILLVSGACRGTAHADRIAPKPVLTSARSPYTIELIGQNGQVLDTYRHGARSYVQGNAGERYTIRVTNPTDRRVEAVMSVDGLDVVDGETANFRSKRGYIVPAHNSLDIDGFRVSTREVAAFRFSSVASSYAGRKGKARNVGLVGVAIFAEQESEVLALPQPLTVRGERKQQRGPVPESFDDNVAPRDRSQNQPAAEGSTADRSSARAGVRASTRSRSLGSGAPTRRIQEERPGLGTAFGERRTSSVRFTSFVRANANKPTAIAELRYNDSQGLRALGIRLRETPNFVSADELATRETASSFPDSRFASPPGF